MAFSLSPRDPHEPNRAATPLEIFFDLVSVIAIAAAAAGLHHAIADNHIAEGVIKYAAMFFAIWWAWMNFTWFASAYDNGGAHYIVSVFIMMFGSLMMAAGVADYFKSGIVVLPVIGWCITRLALSNLWLRAAFSDRERRTTALRYGIGLLILQAGWVLSTLYAQETIRVAAYGVLIAGELFLPWYAERAEKTTWHKHHIVERHGLLNIIVLGEGLLAVTHALQAAYHDGAFNMQLVPVILSGMIIFCTLWWLYFSERRHQALDNFETAFTWGYGHWLIFSSGAAAGAGLAVMIEAHSHSLGVSSRVVFWAVSLPAALYCLGLWTLFDRFSRSGGAILILPLSALILTVLPFFTVSPYAIAAVLVASAVFARAH